MRKDTIFFRKLKVSGTGSYPLPPQGWQLNIRLVANQRPFNGPCFFTACTAYSEHVGVYLHDGGFSGEIAYR